LTVGMPVYKAMPYLPEAVESILRQTYTDFRFLIVDDGSTDASAEYLDSITDPRVTVVHQGNRGLGATLNRTLELCDTEYYARMDADDACHPRRLELQLRHLESHPEVGLLGTQVTFLTSDREVPGPKKPLGHEAIGELLLGGVYAICHASTTMRAALARDVDGYRISGAGQDLDFFLRMHEATVVENLPAALYRIRIHGGSLNCLAQKRVQMGRAYAIECAQRRRRGEQEPSLGEFAGQWERRSPLAKLRDRIEAWSVVQYRRSLLDMAESRRLSGAVRLGASACCRPKAVWRRIRQWRSRDGLPCTGTRCTESEEC